MGQSGLRKPWWGWKSRSCAELAGFDIPFAVKEYCQNQVGQVLKALETRVWSDWERRDLTAYSPQARQLIKADLEATHRAMFTGPHGAALRHSDWLPLYIAKATIPRNRIQGSTRDTDLKLCTVLWEHIPTKLCGLSFFNNHLDANASFSSFVVDGESTSRYNEWAVGEKGKGFVLATQYFFEKVERTVSRLEQPKSLKPGVTFRIGHELGELKWKKGKHDVDQLKVTKDDLTPTDLAGLMARRGLDDDSYDESSSSEGDKTEQQQNTVPLSAISSKAARSLKAVYKRRFKYKMLEKRAGITEASSPAHETSFVSDDEVSITILGLPQSSPSEVFSGVYGITPPEKAWYLPNSQVQFFKLAENQVRFYLRDQIIPSAPTLKRLSVNYQGDMQVTSDRRVVLTHGDEFDAYCQAIGEAADKAFRRGAHLELATELALEILEEKTNATISITSALNPTKAEAGSGYRAAFKRAWKLLEPQAPSDATFWPFPKAHPEDLEIIQELDMFGCAVSDRVMNILEKSGAYTRIRPHTETLLLEAPEVKDEVPGLDRFRHGLKSILGQDHLTSISMRKYSYSTPRILWDPDAREFVFALPDACDEHEEESGCLCWVGPFIFEAVENWRATEDGPGPSMDAIFRGFMKCMEGVVGMYEPEDEGHDQRKDVQEEEVLVEDSQEGCKQTEPRRPGENPDSSSATTSSSGIRSRRFSNESTSASSSSSQDSPGSSQNSSRSNLTKPVALKVPVSSTAAQGPNHSAAEVMDQFNALSAQMEQLGVLLQHKDNISKAERTRIVDLEAQLDEVRQQLRRKREQLKRERQISAATKERLEREKEELEDRLEHTQELLQNQWNSRSEERKAKRRREE